jgi:hypothetical protein
MECRPAALLQLIETMRGATTSPNAGETKLWHHYVQQLSPATCLKDPVAGTHAWCHNFAKCGQNEVMAPEGGKMRFNRPTDDRLMSLPETTTYLRGLTGKKPHVSTI